ncbi:hypothetical protein SUDANB60_04394 [Streptomyces sp. enrichment culture]
MSRALPEPPPRYADAPDGTVTAAWSPQHDTVTG